MGRKLKIKVPVVTTEFITYEAERAANDVATVHEGHANPHPQYTTEQEVQDLLPRFVTHWKWS